MRAAQGAAHTAIEDDPFRQFFETIRHAGGMRCRPYVKKGFQKDCQFGSPPITISN